MALQFKLSTALLLVGLAINHHGHAQEYPTHNVYAELGGPGLAYSVNYDTRFADAHKGLGLRAGVGFWTVSPENLHRFVLPVQLNYLAGKQRLFFEAGAGTTLLHSGGGGDSIFDVTDKKGTSVIGTISCGYRYQAITKGINARVGGSLNFHKVGLPLPYPALSFGYTFPKNKN